MDELEISGKRYISTRRAAKEYKYHADYIGQLIRGKKLIAEKVGRSWYVEAKSLAEYFGKEISAEQAPSQELPASAELPSQKSSGVLASPEGQSLRQTFTPEVSPPQEKMEENVLEKSEANDVSEGVPERVVRPEADPARLQTFRSSEKVGPEEISLRSDVEIKESPRDAIHIPIRRPSFSTEKKNPGLRYVSDDTPVLPQIKKASRLAAVQSVMPQTEEEAEEIITEVSIETPTPSVFKPVMTIAVVGVIVFLGVTMSSLLVSARIIVEEGQPASVEYSLR